MAEIYVKHKKTYLLVKVIGFFIYLNLFFAGALFVLHDVIGFFAGFGMFTNFTTKDAKFIAGCVFLISLLYLCKKISKKLEHDYN